MFDQENSSFEESQSFNNIPLEQLKDSSIEIVKDPEILKKAMIDYLQNQSEAKVKFFPRRGSINIPQDLTALSKIIGSKNYDKIEKYLLIFLTYLQGSAIFDNFGTDHNKRRDWYKEEENMGRSQLIYETIEFPNQLRQNRMPIQHLEFFGRILKKAGLDQLSEEVINTGTKLMGLLKGADVSNIKNTVDDNIDIQSNHPTNSTNFLEDLNIINDPAKLAKVDQYDDYRNLLSYLRSDNIRTKPYSQMSNTEKLLVVRYINKYLEKIMQKLYQNISSFKTIPST